MAGIPHEIAFNLSLAMNNMETQDSRMQIHELVGQLAVIQKIEIDLVLPNTDVYQATIYLTMEGFQKQVTFQMIPSHATLLAVLNEAEIFVADTLVKQALAMRSEEI
jgi:bifunctional DNase/RNase